MQNRTRQPDLSRFENRKEGWEHAADESAKTSAGTEAQTGFQPGEDAGTWKAAGDFRIKAG